jgi:hypothetical protein
LLINNNGTPLALSSTAMIRLAEMNGYLPQNFSLAAIESKRFRRTFASVVIQRVTALNSAAGSTIHIFLKQIGERTDEVFGAIFLFRPIRPSRFI